MTTALQDPPTLAGRRDLYLGRQPILDRRHELYAFELLFRSGTRNAAVFDDDTQATAMVISNAFHELGVDSALGRYRGFINLSEAMLMSDMIGLLPKDKVVLEVLETVRPSPAVTARLEQLRAAGFSLALDDVASADAAYEPLLPYVDYVKIDLKQVRRGELPGLARHFRASGAALLAEKVDTREEAQQCLALGFSYFQGYYFARPEVISGKKLAPSEATLLDLLGLVLTEAEQSAIEETLKRDPALSVNVLRLANSAASGLRRRAASVGAAVMLLGRRQLQRWVQILLYAGDAGNSLPSPLMQLAATRGRMMELIAPRVMDARGAEFAFLTGILSLLDALLRRPLAEIVASLPVPGEVGDALLRRRGVLGTLLALCERVEAGDAAGVARVVAALPGVSPADLNRAHRDALRWANSIAESGA
ncbi:MAG: EAL domain-containing protein [Burkholderiales bacterium]|nr:EAL domain-containing protein [Burkholderiales bacterium]